MKVLLVSNLYPPQVVGGYELACHDIASLLRANGHEVAIATSRPFNNPEEGFENENCVHRVFQPVFHFDGRLSHEMPLGGVARHLRTMAFAGVIPCNAMALAQCIKSCRPDQIWIFNPLALGPVGMVETALTAGKPVLIVLADDLDGVVAENAARLAWLPRWAALKQHVNAAACSVKTLRNNEVHGRYLRHAVIPLPASVPDDRPHAPAAQGPMRLVYFGQLASHKGILQSLKALTAFHQTAEGREARLDLIGGGTAAFAREIQAAVSALGLAEFVKVLGPMERADLHRLLSRYDAALLLLPDEEAFGMVAVEAVALGLPPILTAKAGASDLFPRDYPLMVNDRTNGQEVCAKLQWCARHREVLRPLADECAAHLRMRVAPQKVISELLHFAAKAPAPCHPFSLQELINVTTMLEIRQIL